MIKNVIQDVYCKLCSLETYKPVHYTNAIMKDVYAIILTYKWDDYSPSSIEVANHIRQIMYQTEYEMEKDLANKIIILWREEFFSFQYYKNYISLVCKERKSVSPYITTTNSVLFVWGWPVPFTAIILAQEYGISSVVIDNSLEAVQLSQKVVDSMGLWAYITIEHDDLKSHMSSKTYSCCYVASMVFHSDNHANLLTSLFHIISPSTPLVLRSTHGKRKIFYRPIDDNILHMYFTIYDYYIPQWSEELINSFYLCYVK